MFVDFFIKRPIFSTVIAIIIVLAGAVCVKALPVAQFPQIAPPVVQVTATYTGASAEVLEQTVTQPLEEQINGVEGMMYMNSTSSDSGQATINVTFEIGYDLDIANVDVQNRVNIALPQLPEDVRRYGVTTQKQSTNFILMITLISPSNTHDDLFLSNYAAINIVDAIKRIPGVGNVTIFGERKYSMRFWLDPDKMTSMALTASDVINAINDQNIQVAAGSIGQSPAPKNQAFQYTVVTEGRLTEVKEFEEIIIKVAQDGAIVRMKDIAEVELGAENYTWYTDLNSQKSASIGVFQLPDANSVDIADEVYVTMENLATRFPADIKYLIPYDTTKFVRASIQEVVETLFIAIFLVIFVIFIFLQNWRSTIIPAVTIPVSLVGTFAVMMAFGFSINTLTLFGLVLAIGTVVDDAIVVVENVSRIIEEEGLPPPQATSKAMSQVVGPVIATSLVLFAVFIPVAFMPGLSGQLYKQFALTIAFSVGISTINALSLSPAMCALFLKPKGNKKQALFFIKFNEWFDRASHKYTQWVDLFIRKWRFITIGFLVMIVLTYGMMRIVPTGFVPAEDQGYFMIVMLGPEGTSLPKTTKVAKEVEQMAMNIDGIDSVLTIGGYNLINSSIDSSTTSFFVMLTPWDQRTSSKLSLASIVKKFNKNAQLISEALVFAFNPPPIQGLSTTGGFQFEVQDYEGGSLDSLSKVANKLIAESKNYKQLGQLSTTFQINYPRFYVDLDRTKAKSLGISIQDIFITLQTYLGSIYVNDFNKYGRVYRVFAQAKERFRSQKSNIAKFYVRSESGELIPLSALVRIKEDRGAQTVTHYNIFRAADINGNPAPGYSSGQAIAAMENLAAKVLPDGYGYDWTGTAQQEIEAGGKAPLFFALALVFVFLILAAQYESWSMPLMIMLAVPLAILGALSAQWTRGLSNDVYCQIGLVMLIGLASKNSILIVEFAKDLREQGMGVVEAAIQACKIRLRPILMTAFSFIFGVLPLVFASGAGAASRHSLGTAVFGGMVVATFLSLILVPVLFVVIEGIREGGAAVFFKKLRNKKDK